MTPNSIRIEPMAPGNLGRRTSLTRGNGTSTSYGFNAASQLASLTQNLSGTTVDITTTYTYNPAFQITQRVRGNDSYAWGGAVAGSQSFPVDGLNRYTPLIYDVNQNLKSAGTPVYTYDFENRLISATNPTATFEYDPLGRLSRTTGSSTYRLGYDGDDLIAEYNDSNMLLRRYVHGPGSDEPLVWYEIGGTTARKWLHADERGSVAAISNDSGASTAINTYDECGVPGSGNIGRFQYTGQQWLADLGMYHYKARVYSATLGRFLQTDPLSYAAGDMNLYAYVGNDPMNFVDPTGTFCDLYGDWSSLTGWSNIHCHYTGDFYFGDGGYTLAPMLGFSLSGFANTPPSGQGREGEAQEQLETVLVTATKPFDWGNFANDWWPGYSLGTCIYQGLTGGGCGASGWVWAAVGGLPLPEGKVLQTGGRVISNATAKALNKVAGTDLARREWGRALEALKRSLGLPPDFHGRIMNNGNFVNPGTGDVLGNITHYIP